MCIFTVDVATKTNSLAPQHGQCNESAPGVRNQPGSCRRFMCKNQRSCVAGAFKTGSGIHRGVLCRDWRILRRSGSRDLLRGRDPQRTQCILRAAMSWKTQRQRVSRTLAVFLLAFAIGAQFGLVGHQHVDGKPVADCLQCQFDHGKAAISSNSLSGFHAPAHAAPESVTLVGIVAAHYAFNARGPPLLS